MNEFETLGLIEPIMKSIRDENFETPTKIQAKTIPLILDGKDVIGKSSTGSGKTLAFAAGIIQNIDKGKGIQAIILTPTRELAEQVKDAFKKFAKHRKLVATAIYGGVSIEPQMKKLTKTDVVIATPGRMLDHIQRGTINLKNVKILVLDEADRMLDMGFLPDVDRIIGKCPYRQQTLLFSATISTEIKKLCGKYMNNPIRIDGSEQVDPNKLKQVYYDISDTQKFPLLVHLLKAEMTGLVMIFCNTRQNVDFVVKNLKLNQIDAVAIHGGFTQSKRSKTMEKFQSNKAHALVCTDVAARGLDIPAVSHVYNYDLPTDSKDYVHRIGRTARAGSEGIAVNVLGKRDHNNFSQILRDYSAMKVRKMEIPHYERVEMKKTIPERRGRERTQRIGQGGRSEGKGGARGGRRPAFGGGLRSQSRSFGSSRSSSSSGFRSERSESRGTSSEGSFGSRRRDSEQRERRGSSRSSSEGRSSGPRTGGFSRGRDSRESSEGRSSGPRNRSPRSAPSERGERKSFRKTRN